jgi:hypothetical protein
MAYWPTALFLFMMLSGSPRNYVCLRVSMSIKGYMEITVKFTVVRLRKLNVHIAPQVSINACVRFRDFVELD